MTRSDRLPWLLTFAAVLAPAAILLAMGRLPICECGYVRLWVGDPDTSDNSQHIADWCTPSHVIHGFLFYWLARLALPRTSFAWRLLAATLVEAAWEITENTDWIINRYRDATISLDYFGDSVLNSTMDLGAMMLGFWLASRLPVWLTVSLALGFEALTAWLIRDGLLLNVLMLVWPLDSVRIWQDG